MTARRPIVRAGGRDQQLPPGDTVLGLPVYLSAFQQDGTLLRLALAINYALPVYRAGGPLNVQVMLNG
ncbi:hypothetical protein [Pseudomonas sp.]|uniref:hypothetical protein n=1 Tax=Pseudomonas sp. TaxID=306 RepID=UPI002730E663|nr:hypothetical protein [Pseudomonas sp.]MDP2244004.1 hypothetical protein [Pseudomonas sp.]